MDVFDKVIMMFRCEYRMLRIRGGLFGHSEKRTLGAVGRPFWPGYRLLSFFGRFSRKSCCIIEFRRHCAKLKLTVQYFQHCRVRLLSVKLLMPEFHRNILFYGCKPFRE